MKAGELVTAADIEAMLKAQGLAQRGILPGDVVYVRTGWGDHWRDPDTEKFYYTKAPGLSYDAAQWLAARRVVAIALDTPFVDTVAEGHARGQGRPGAGHARRGCLSRCTTTCSRRPASTSSRTRSSTSWRRQGVDLLHHGAAAARKRCGRVGGAPGRDRGSRRR